MQMRADFVAGDQRVMLQCLIEVFAHMGWDENQIARMFENPFFLASHGLTKRFGRAAVRECIRQTLQRCGVFRCVMNESKSTRKSQFVSVPVSGDDSRRAKSKPKNNKQRYFNGRL